MWHTLTSRRLSGIIGDRRSKASELMLQAPWRLKRAVATARPKKRDLKNNPPPSPLPNYDGLGLSENRA